MFSIKKIIINCQRLRLQETRKEIKFKENKEKNRSMRKGRNIINQFF